MDLLEVLRNQAGRYECPTCGQSLADCQLDLISAAESEAIVQITCAHCQASRLVEVQTVASGVERVPVLDQAITSDPAITADDVLDVRLALAGHRGDLTSLLAS
jgi:hypothetical protein